MKSVSKKELRQDTQKTLLSLFAQHQIAAPSKRTEKLLSKVSKRVSSQLKQEIKKLLKKDQKASKKAKGKDSAATAA